MCFWACLSGVAAAQTVVVRSGEHGGFTRLVLKLPDRVTWRLSHAGRRVQVYLEGAAVDLDLSQAFDRIARTRLAGLSRAGPGQPLELRLACDCPVEAHTGRNRLLIVDIADPVRSKSGSLTAAHIYRLPERYRLQQRWSPPKIGALAANVISDSPPPRKPLLPTAATAGTKRPTAPALPHFDLAAQLNLSELRLLEQIGRAAHQGLLTPRAPATPIAAPLANGKPSQGEPVAPANVRAPAAPARRQAGDLSGRNQIQISPVTSADRDRAAHDLLTAAGAEPHCAPSSAVAIADWGGAAGLTELGPSRMRLYADTGRPSPDGAISLAKLYLHLGFGQEALQTLDLVGRADGTLGDLARIMDADPETPPPNLARQIDCRTDVALWAFLAQPPKGAPLPAGATDFILRAFSKLPDHLRVHFGPRLSSRFLGHGDTDIAAKVLRLVDPAAEAPPEGARLAQAEIDLARGDPAAAKAHLTAAVAAQTGQSPEALVTLVEDLHARHAPPDSDLASLTGAYVTELGASDLGPALRRAHVLALLLANRYAEAFDALHDIPARDGNFLDRTYADAARDLADRADDLVFLELAHRELVGGLPLPPAVGDMAASRLLKLGFPRSAETVIARPLSARRSASRRKLRAQIALATNRPEDALTELSGLDGRDADALRATAYLQTGDYAEAAVALSDVENGAGMLARARWLSDMETPAGAPASAGRFGTAIKLTRAISEHTIADGAASPLARARILLSDSAGTRKNIEDLLRTVPPPAD